MRRDVVNRTNMRASRAAWGGAMGLAAALGVLSATACGGSPTGLAAPCAGEDDCETGDLCLSSTPDGYCSARCATDDDCPVRTACSSLMGGVCLKLCLDNEDCNIDRDEATMLRCVPSAGSAFIDPERAGRACVPQ